MMIFKGGPLDGMRDSLSAAGEVIVAKWVGGNRGYLLCKSDKEPLAEMEEKDEGTQ